MLKVTVDFHSTTISEGVAVLDNWVSVECVCNVLDWRNNLTLPQLGQFPKGSLKSVFKANI